MTALLLILSWFAPPQPPACCQCACPSEAGVLRLVPGDSGPYLYDSGILQSWDGDGILWHYSGSNSITLEGHYGAPEIHQ